jgi:hypothetical protein
MGSGNLLQIQFGPGEPTENQDFAGVTNTILPFGHGSMPCKLARSRSDRVLTLFVQLDSTAFVDPSRHSGTDFSRPA